MSKVMVNESSLTAIGDAIRQKNGTNTKYMPSQMGAAILNIVSGGGALDFSALQYAELTSNALIDIPDLSIFTNDFSKVVLLGIQSSNAFYLYLRGTDTNRTSYPELFYFGANTVYSTPYDTSGTMFHIKADNMASIIVYDTENNRALTRPFKGKLIMFYEEG